MPVCFFANSCQMLKISIICGISNSSVVPRIMYANNGDTELIVTNILISSKIRMTIGISPKNQKKKHCLMCMAINICCCCCGCCCCLIISNIIGFFVGKWADIS